MISKQKVMKSIGVLLSTVAFALVLVAAGTTSAATWPEKGKVITVYVGAGAGGGADMSIRLIAPFLEQELGTRFVIVNKPGGASQIANTEYLSKAGTDGYTALMITPSLHATYLDPARKATYSFKDLQLVASLHVTTIGIAVQKGRFKTLKELVEAAKANPGKLRATSAGPLAIADIGIFSLEKAAGISFAHMYFDQQGEQRAALLGGHVDVEFNPIQELVPGHKSGEVAVLGYLAERQSQYLPDLPSADAQGYKAAMESYSGLAYKTGTSQEIIRTLAAAIKKAEASPEFQKQADKANLTYRFIAGKDYEDYHRSFDARVKELLERLAQRR